MAKLIKKITKKSTDKSGPISRRQEVRRALAPDRPDWRSLLDRPAFFTSIGIALLFIAGVSSILIWTQSQPIARTGQIMFDTLAARIDFQIIDNEATRTAKEAAAASAPVVYRAVEGRFKAITAPLYGLPKAVAGKQTVADLPPDLVKRLRLTPASLTELQKWVNEQGEPTPQWKQIVDQFVQNRLYRNPIITGDQWAREQLAPAGGAVELHIPDPNSPNTVNTSNTSNTSQTASPTNHEQIVIVKRSDLLSVDSDRIEERLAEMVRVFPTEIRATIQASLMHDLAPLFQYDEAATLLRQKSAAEAVLPQEVTYEKGTVIYTAGQPLSADQLILLKAERKQFATRTTPAELWSQRIGLIGLVTLLTSVMAGCIGMFRPVLFRKSLRLFVLMIITMSMLAIATALTSVLPAVFVGIIITATLLLTVILVVAYGRTMALGLGCIFAIFIAIALPLPVGYLAVIVGALGLNAWQLREIRDRNRLLRAGAISGLGAAFGAVILALLYRPLNAPGFGWALLVDTIGAGASGILVGIFMLGILSSVERLFNVTTGLTLVELRDPKQPLLRRLLERAPGTWNHSLQVAAIAESAADAIGADSLLTYVGALYHDIGKMNKPGYFIENQSDGENRHAKLSPAMSLLIIVGHVKDGIEMAREFNLPKVLHHFIEAHHGTTLVEYFYHMAKERAESGETNDEVQEVEYRYPGPKPNTKEAAILMIADAVESASRAMTEKSPIRIEQLVRTIGKKRLLDGQFDNCDLTLRELHQVEESIIKSLNAMHHARISYPSDAKPEEDAKPNTAATSKATA